VLFHGPAKVCHGPVQSDSSGAAVFTDEMDVDKHVYNYLIFRHGQLTGDISSRFNCSFGLRRGAVDSLNDRRQYRLQVSDVTVRRKSLIN